MPYDKTDPRSALGKSAASGGQAADSYAGMEYVRFYELEPTETQPGLKTWYGRGQNFTLAYSEAEPGAEINRENQPDEYVLLMPDAESSLELSAADESASIAGNCITFVPGGNSTIKFNTRCRLVRLFSIRSEDIAAKAHNAASYAEPHANVALFEPWPDPVEGYKIRTYSLDVPPEEGRFGRIWRCSTFMVNYLDPMQGPRPTNMMSPHAHDDFEQCSLVLAGEFHHHVRWPWGTNMEAWREDEHEACGTPSIAVIPPPSIHTTNSVDPGLNQLVDIFCPPRMDFSQKEGWVLNSEEYPMPDQK
jgi:hypothetical protein